VIEAKNISVTLGGRQILGKVNAAFRSGTITAILGPNGAGKSTLLKCLTGAVKPTNGAVYLDGRELSDYSLEDLSRRRAVLSQATPISFPFTAHEIVSMGRNPYSMIESVARNHEIADAALEKVDAWHLRDRSFPTLSGGEQQRIQFARVMAQIWETEGATLLLDEPTSALDLKHQHQLLDLIHELCEERRLTVVIVMHDLSLAYHCTDNCYFIKAGRIQGGEPSRDLLTPQKIAEVFDLPEKYAVQRFGVPIAD